MRFICIIIPPVLLRLFLVVNQKSSIRSPLPFRAEPRSSPLHVLSSARVCLRTIPPGVAALRALPRAIDIVALRATPFPDRKLKHTVNKVSSLQDAPFPHLMCGSASRKQYYRRTEN
jgi:hypothetical protein